MNQDLINLGCVPNKSLILKFPTEEQVPEKFLSHFIRGFFDGDGSVTKNKIHAVDISFCSVETFLIPLSNFLKSKLNINISKFYKRYKHKLISAGSIFIYQRYDNPIFYNYIYKDAGKFYIKRKKEKFEL
jgi:intein-encoded DNA endonuclease-like protein